MNRLIVIIVTLFVSINLYSQPQISYIIPDIGTPDMSTYVEIISPFAPDNPDDSRGNFGVDGFTVPAIGQVKTLHASDAWKLTFSQMIVSWDGRLISAQVFVHPYLQPNSSDWEELTSAFRIPIVVQIGSEVSNVDTFYIVQPTQLGDIQNNPDRVLGTATLGKRSRRGAMIVDSILFANARYTVSTIDCDPSTGGNQGYLSLVLLSKGKIQGRNNTIIDISGERSAGGHGGHGGPGGGGGGGRFCDVLFGSGGDNGGNGFVAGGRGGHNVATGGGGFKSFGQATGTNGISLNGVLGPENASSNWEASGGGTGHPFGLSGKGTGDGNVDNPTGGFGGGSGFSQRKNGGSGGYATSGANSLGRNQNNEFSQSGGKVNGNDMVVPLAGGSGGASGNPNSLNECSGSGGGGGGAIVLYAPEIDNIVIYANGGDGNSGTDGDATRGGSGSGGFSGIFSKMYVNRFTMQVEGGYDQDDDMTGGAGRMRYDIPDWNIADLNLPADASHYRGITTDTSKFVKRIFTLTGSKEESKRVYAYIKGEKATQWTEIKNLPVVGNEWSVDIDLFTDKSFCDDSLFYFVVYQAESRTGNIAEHNMTPEYVLSHAATNIFHIIPDINGDETASIQLTKCEGIEKDTIEFEIRNEGGPSLELDIAGSYFESPANGYDFNGFKIISPDPNVDGRLFMQSCQSTTISVEYSYQQGHSDLISTQLFIPHNDFDILRNNPWEVDISVAIDSFALQSRDLNTNRLNTTDNILDLGEICLGDSIISNFWVQNFSSLDCNLMTFEFSNHSDQFTSAPVSSNFIASGDELQAYIKFANPDMIQTYRTRIYIKPIECEYAIDSFDVEIDIIENDLNFYYNSIQTDIIDFGKVKIGESKTENVALQNDGSGQALITATPGIIQSINDFKLSNLIPNLPQTLLSNAANQIDFSVNFQPTIEGPQSATLTVISDDSENPISCPGFREIILIAEGLKAEVTAYPLDFGLHANCESMILDSIQVTNTGETSVQIISTGEITGTDANYFKIINPRQAPYTLNTGETQYYLIEFNPSIPPIGTKTATFHLISDDVLDPDIYTEISVEIDSVYVMANPEIISFGGVPVPDIRTADVEIVNNGLFNVQISHVEINDNLVNTSPNIDGTILTTGESRTITIQVDFTEFRDVNTVVKVIIDTPCDDTLFINVYGTGLEGEWSYNNFYDFGSVPFCESSSHTFTFTNLGDPLIEIRDMRIIPGIDSDLFSLLGPDPVPPVVLARDEVYSREIKFSPLNSTEGIKSAIVELEFFVNGELKTATVNLQGERYTGLLSQPETIDFGEVFLQYTETDVLRLTNIGTIPIRIEQILPLVNHPTVFSATLISGTIPGTLNPNDYIEVEIDFSPTQELEYIDTLRFEISQPCVETKNVVLRGDGTPALNSRVWIPDLELNPNQTNVRIPIYMAFQEANTDVSDINLTVQLSFKDDVFFPKELSNNGTIISNYSDINGFRYLEISADNLSISDDENVLIEIVGDALLGLNTYSDITFSNSEFISQSSPFTPIVPEDGSITLKICREGGDRLIQLGEPTAMIVNPNPANEIVKITGNALESGHHKIILVSINGTEKNMLNWNSNGNEEYEFAIDASEISSGVYYLILHSPARTQTIPIYIIK